MDLGLTIFLCLQVQQDLADFTVPGYGCSFARMADVNCARAVNWNQLKLYTQFPMEASKFWNLLNLFTPESWSWIAGTILTLILTLKISVHLGAKLGMKTKSVEIILVPFR